MDILVSLDHNYVMPCSVLLTSLLENNKDEEIHCHVTIDSSITEQDINDIKLSFPEGHGNYLSFYDINKIKLPRLPLSAKHSFTEPTYYRLFSATILPPNINKVLYIDGDAVVVGRLKELWNMDVSEVAVAGVIDSNQGPTHYNRIGLKKDKDYINAGVLLINLQYWRNHSVEQRFREYLEFNDPEYVDQDVINYVCVDEKKVIPLKYNIMSTYLYKKDYASYFYYDYVNQIKDALAHPVIFHFVGSSKPWFLDSDHPMKKMFLDYYKRTKWANVPLEKRKMNMVTTIKYYLNKFGLYTFVEFADIYDRTLF